MLWGLIMSRCKRRESLFQKALRCQQQQDKERMLEARKEGRFKK